MGKLPGEAEAEQKKGARGMSRIERPNSRAAWRAMAPLFMATAAMACACSPKDHPTSPVATPIVQGIVEFANHVPAVSANVILQSYRDFTSPTSPSGFYASTATDPSGAFSFSGMPPGNYELLAGVAKGQGELCTVRQPGRFRIAERGWHAWRAGDALPAHAAPRQHGRAATRRCVARSVVGTAGRLERSDRSADVPRGRPLSDHRRAGRKLEIDGVYGLARRPADAGVLRPVRGSSRGRDGPGRPDSAPAGMAAFEPDRPASLIRAVRCTP